MGCRVRAPNVQYLVALALVSACDSRKTEPPESLAETDASSTASLATDANPTKTNASAPSRPLQGPLRGRTGPLDRTAAEVTERDGAIFAVGRVQGVRNLALARATAANRARAAIARFVAGTPEDGPTLQKLQGIQIVEYWTEPGSGTVYARARLDLSGP